ncbi:MAG: DivIVA domain-containing protein [Clostridia bacterium]|nr:DivIVA domain-containing protein [Clostridia bacterium]
MLNLQEIRNYFFEKAGSNRYRAESVDIFKTQVIEFIEKLMRDNSDMARKLAATQSKLDEVKDQEDSIRSALLNAQRLGDSIVRESKAKAESIVNQTNESAGQILIEAQSRADEMVHEAQKETQREHQAYERIREEVTSFRQKLLNAYKEHIELINDLPNLMPEEQPSQLPAADADPLEVTEPQPEIEPEVKEVKPAAEEEKAAKPKYDLSFLDEQ